MVSGQRVITMRTFLCRLTLCFLMLAAGGTALAVERMTFVVEARDQARVDAPASVLLPADVAKSGVLRLIETTGDRERPVPAQVEAGKLPRLWVNIRRRCGHLAIDLAENRWIL
jgi:hypothetical protein